MIVMSLVGPIGVGKTSVINLLKERRFKIKRENYIECDINNLDNRLIISKWNWIADWYNQIIQLSKKCIEKNDLIISDRSPIEAGIWTGNCSPLYKALEVSFHELTSLNIFCKHIYLKCDSEVLWKRVQNRLMNEPERIKYNEGNRSFFDELLKAYENHSELWDYIIDTSQVNPIDIVNNIINLIN